MPRPRSIGPSPTRPRPRRGGGCRCRLYPEVPYQVRDFGEQLFVALRALLDDLRPVAVEPHPVSPSDILGRHHDPRNRTRRLGQTRECGRIDCNASGAILYLRRYTMVRDSSDRPSPCIYLVDRRETRETANYLTGLLFAALLLAGCGGQSAEESGSTNRCNMQDPPLYTKGVLTVATDRPAYPPWFKGSPKNYSGY